MGLPATIRTSVSSQAITKVTRLFNGTVGDVLNELLQNARRAGATNVAIETLDLAGHPTLAIRDDGVGITDPAVLISLGRSGWDEPIQTREDPAGMGVFSLAGRRVEIRSRARGTAEGWRVVIPADAWETSAEIPVEPFAMDEGTEIHIDLPLAWERSLESAAAAAAKFLPIPVTLNGHDQHREDFLADAFWTEMAAGCRIGVFLNREHRASDIRINFHGVALPAELPQIREERGGAKSVENRLAHIWVAVLWRIERISGTINLIRRISSRFLNGIRESINDSNLSFRCCSQALDTRPAVSWPCARAGDRIVYIVINLHIGFSCMPAM